MPSRSRWLPAGSVVNGGIYRHDFHEHDEHERSFKQHFVTKGHELASAIADVVPLPAVA